MIRDLNTMEEIMARKDRELAAQPVPELTPEIRVLAEGKRFTFDIVDAPLDPLR